MKGKPKSTMKTSRIVIAVLLVIIAGLLWWNNSLEHQNKKLAVQNALLKNAPQQPAESTFRKVMHKLLKEVQDASKGIR